MRCYGSIQFDGNGWSISDLEPHVAIRFKQLFPKVPKSSSGPFHLPDDPIHAADLQWFLSRYPLSISEEDSNRLTAGANRFRDSQAEMEKILLPTYQMPERCAGLRDGQQLRRYQWQAIQLLQLRKSLLLGDEGGLGKTYTAAGFLANQPDALPAAVVCDPHMQTQWKDKITVFTHLRVHIIRQASPYNLPEADVYVFRISQILGWVDIFAQGIFKSVVFDEPQSLRTGTKTSKGAAAKVLSDNASYRVGLTATPIYNYGIEMWNVAQFIDDTVLGSYEDFSREWVDSRGRIADPKALGSYLREQNFLLRRLKTDLGMELPKVSKIVEHVEYNEKSVRSIEDIARQLAIRATTGSFLERGQAARDLDILVRQTTGVAKAKTVAQFAKLMVEAGEAVLLVGWHRSVYEIWLTELSEYQPAMYTGSESASKKEKEKQRFLSGDTPILILSLRSGAGLDGLQFRSSVVLFGELDWSPGIHQQIIWRLDREGQKNPVTAFFLVTEEGSDPPMMDVLGIKASEAVQIVDPFIGAQSVETDTSHLQKLVQKYLRNNPKKIDQNG